MGYIDFYAKSVKVNAWDRDPIFVRVYDKCNQVQRHVERDNSPIALINKADLENIFQYNDLDCHHNWVSEGGTIAVELDDVKAIISRIYHELYLKQNDERGKMLLIERIENIKMLLDGLIDDVLRNDFEPEKVGFMKIGCKINNVTND